MGLKKELIQRLDALIPEEVEEITYVCIGTDKDIIDSFGPITGSLLNKGRKNRKVIGTVQKPLHALNIEHRQKEWENDKFVIAIDAALTSDSNRDGTIKIRNHHIRPGAGVGKDLPAVGNISIIMLSYKTNFELRLTGLNQVYECAQLTVNAIKELEKIRKKRKERKQYFNNLVGNFLKESICGDYSKLCDKVLGSGAEKICFDLNENYVIKMPIGLIELMSGMGEEYDKNNYCIPIENQTQALLEMHIDDEREIYIDDYQICNEIRIYAQLPKDIKKYFASIVFHNTINYMGRKYTYYIQEKVEENSNYEELWDAMNNIRGGSKAVNKIEEYFEENHSEIWANDFLQTEYNYGYDEKGKIKIFDFEYEGI